MTISGMGSAGMRRVMSGANLRMSPAQKMSDLFQKIDTNAIFNKLDSSAPAGPCMLYSIFLFGAMVFQP